MPWKVVKVKGKKGGKGGYKVKNTETGKTYSKKPMTKAMAKRQLGALYALAKESVEHKLDLAFGLIMENQAWADNSGPNASTLSQILYRAHGGQRPVIDDPRAADLLKRELNRIGTHEAVLLACSIGDMLSRESHKVEGASRLIIQNWNKFSKNVQDNIYRLLRLSDETEGLDDYPASDEPEDIGPPPSGRRRKNYHIPPVPKNKPYWQR